ncbi:MAG TPA: hypothetical protein VF756_15780 [Thermoanaerobaculia bacterium]
MSRRNVPRILAVALVVAALLAAIPARSEAAGFSLGEPQGLWSRVWDWLGSLWDHSSSQPTAVWEEDGTTSSSGESPGGGGAGTQSTPPDSNSDSGSGFDPNG